MRLDPSDPRPLYQVVADDLRRAITSGTYRAGDKLPAGRELARDYGIAPMTVNNALALLRDEGLIAPRQGRGVYVLDPARRPATADSGSQRLASLEEEVTALRDRVSALEDKVNTPSEVSGRRADTAGRPSRGA